MKEIILPQSIVYIGEHSFEKNEWGGTNSTIKGYKDSCAQKYALNNNFPFAELQVTEGDVNGDGLLSAVVDYVYLIKLVLNYSDGEYIKTADLNNDGIINVFDVMRFKKILL